MYKIPEIPFVGIMVTINYPPDHPFADSYVTSMQMSHLKSIRETQFSSLLTLNRKKSKSVKSHAFIGCLGQILMLP